MKYELQVIETNNKAGMFHYKVLDETGTVISQRKSNRAYVACTINGEYYFGRLDLIGKGDHGKSIKFAQGWGRDSKDKMVAGMFEGSVERVNVLTTIAYRK